MNRRKFFGMTVAALTAAGLPLSLLPEKTIFLSPSHGLWLPPTIREVEQYFINTDSIGLRWDLAFELHGERSQCFVEVDPPMSALGRVQMTESDLTKWKNWNREFARKQLARMIPVGAKAFAPALPRGSIYAAHV